MMPSITTFDSTKESLHEILCSIKEGKTQLPDFQRGWVWDDEHIKSLLASISLSYPIGTVMMLETGNDDVRFKPRLLEGVDLGSAPYPERLILDGQQRLTSLFQALFSNNPVSTRDARGKPIKRWYYLDIAKALSQNGDREEAIVSLPEDRIVRNFRGEVIADYSDTEKECAAGLFPLRLVYDVSALTDWMMKYINLDPEHGQEHLSRWNTLVQEIVQRYQQYQVPLILLRKETPKEAVCQVFEKVNTGGVSLTVFELLTATYAADDFNLREDWEERRKRLNQHKVIQAVKNTDFLQVVTLLATRARQLEAIAQGATQDEIPAISCKRKEVLRLTLAEYKAFADQALDGFERAARLLHMQKIFSSKDLPYPTQLVPLAAILAVLGGRSELDGVRAKIMRWYWCGVFGELYGSGIETRFAKDLPQVLAWVDGGPEPDSINDAHFAPERILTLRTRNSAAYKGLACLLMHDGGLDFRTGVPIDIQLYFDDQMDIHHLFPQEWCRKHGIDPERCDSIVNKTVLSAKTNRMIGSNAPSDYLIRIEKNSGITRERMDEILRSHAIDPEAFRADDFDAFFKAREEALLRRIEVAMGKPIARDVDTEMEVPETAQYEEEDKEEILP